MNQEPKIYFKKPEGFVAKRARVAVCVEAEDKLLILQNALHDSIDGCWTLPGGELEVGEPPELGARRQLKRDTSIDHPLHAIGALYIEAVDGPYMLHIVAVILDERPVVHAHINWILQTDTVLLASLEGIEEVLDIYYKWSLKALLKRFIKEEYSQTDYTDQQLIRRVLEGYARRK